MKYTPQQVREIVGISQETLRHWRRVLSPLKGRRGYAPCFSAGDILALMLTQAITEGLHVRVQTLEPLAGKLFDICRGINWPFIEDQCLIIRLPEEQIETRQKADIISSDTLGAVIVMQLKPYIYSLRDRLMQDDHQRQCELFFPPQGVRSLSK